MHLSNIFFSFKFRFLIESCEFFLYSNTISVPSFSLLSFENILNNHGWVYLWVGAIFAFSRICKIVFFKGNFGFNPGDFIEEVVPNPSDPEEIVNVLTDMMFPETPSQERKQYFIDTFLFDGGSLLQEGNSKYYYWSDLWSKYQGGEKTRTVNDILESLIEALIWSQEYQTT